MAAFVFDSKSSSGFDFSGFSDPYCCSIGPVGGFSEVSRGGSGSGSGSGFVSQSLVLDCERDELVKAPAKVVKKGVSEVKASMALKSHSEAERRRRERINGHLDTLRHILPCTEKMDKATLLAEVIAQLKELQKSAIETTKDLLVPMDTDEVRVEPYNNEAGDRDRDQGRTCFFKASLCCETSPELLKDLRQAVDSIHLRIIKSEISTLGNRSINVFIFAKESAGNDPEELQALADAIREALTSVLEKSAASLEYSPRFGYPSKKRRISYLDSSSSCS